MLLNALLFASTRPSPVAFCCRPENDVYREVRRIDPTVRRFDDPLRAIASLPPGSCLFVLEQGTRGTVSAAHAAGLRAYVELDPSLAVASRRVEWERAVVLSADFGPALPVGRILSIGRLKFAVARTNHPLLSLARVAGFNRLAFGMASESYPLLWSQSGELVASAPLSHFVSGRFAPFAPWISVWRTIFRRLGASDDASRLAFAPPVAPGYGADQALRANAERTAVRRAGEWFLRSDLLLPANGVATYLAAGRWPDRVGPGPHGRGDGTFGLLEGFASQFDQNGVQPVRWYRRADCNAEAAMALALAGSRRVATHLADFITRSSAASQGARANPASPVYGLFGWNDVGGGPGNFYGDDNARAILGLIGTSGALRSHRWDDSILRCILANFRTTGKNGFRGDNLLEGDILRFGWRHFYNADTVNMAPHFEAYLWACCLWAYARTGYGPLLERTENAIGQTVRAGESAWTWTNGLQQERARMLLPLAWLVRVDDTAEHREWLDRFVRAVVAHQAPCGAIQEEIGDLSHGIAGPPRSNAAYGTAETPLIQENGDPVADLLYTTNFAFLGLHEAAAATRDPAYRRAEDKLAAFLCRIQIKSPTHPELDGAWFRAFDFGDWDYWASNADLGWGAWSIETGWSVSWITAILAMRARHEDLWSIDRRFRTSPGILHAMLP